LTKKQSLKKALLEERAGIPRSDPSIQVYKEKELADPAGSFPSFLANVETSIYSRDVPEPVNKEEMEKFLNRENEADLDEKERKKREKERLQSLPLFQLESKDIVLPFSLPPSHPLLLLFSSTSLFFFYFPLPSSSSSIPSIRLSLFGVLSPLAPLFIRVFLRGSCRLPFSFFHLDLPREEEEAEARTSSRSEAPRETETPLHV